MSTTADETIREVAGPDMSIVQAVSRAEIDQAIIAANNRPRSVQNFINEARSLVTLTEAVADDCIYAVPRDGKMIEGPSARMAEILGYSFRNNRIGGRVTDVGREFVTSQGVFQDLERNTYVTYEVQRRITNKRGERFSADMIQVTGNAAASIAMRNAVLKGIPKALWWPVYQAAVAVIAGDSKTLLAKRSEALASLTKIGVTKEMAFAALGIKGVEDITTEHIATLRGLHNSVRDGEIKVEEAFRPKDAAPLPSRADQAKDKLQQRAEQTANANIPNFDEPTAIKVLKDAPDLATLESTWASIKKDFSDTQRQVTLPMDAAYTTRKEALGSETEDDI